MFQPLGLDHDEAAVYRFLVGVPAASAADISAALEMPHTRSNQLIHQLLTRGMISRGLADPDRVVAIAPEVALRGTLSTRQAELARVEAELDALTKAFRLADTERVGTAVVDVVSGWEAVRRTVQELYASITTSVVTTIKAPQLQGSLEQLYEHVSARERGIASRVVIESAVLQPAREQTSQGSQLTPLDADARHGGVRIAETVYARILIVDQRTALVGVQDRSDQTVGAALLIRPSGLLDAVSGLFEMLWGSATVLHPAQVGEIDTAGLEEVQARIMSLLCAGYTDRSIAGILRVSERSVQRHVRTMMDLAGARSRVQLGWYAASEGWVGARQRLPGDPG